MPKNTETVTPQRKKAQAELRSLYGPEEMSDHLQKKVIRAIERNFSEPIKSSSGNLRFELSGPVQVDKALDPYDYGTIAEKLGKDGSGGTYGSKVKGRFKIVETDRNGKEKVHDDTEVTLAKLPSPIFDRSFVVGGRKRYLPAAQFRRKSGVFTLKNPASGEVRAEFNVDPFTSSRVPSFSSYLDQSTEHPSFKLSFNGRKTKIPTAHLAKALGATDQDLDKILGKSLAGEVRQSEKSGAMPYQRSLKLLYDRIHGGKSPIKGAHLGEDELVRAIQEEFGRSKIDPDVSRATLGAPIATVGKTALLKSMKNTMDVSNKKRKPDNRDSLAFKKAIAPYDMLAEAIGHEKEVREMRKRIKGALTRTERGLHDPNRDVLPRAKRMLGNSISKKLTKRLTASQLQRGDAGTNPLDGWAQATITTLLGEGGISANQASRMESAKALDGSQLGTIDPTHTPESSYAGVNVHLSSAAKSRPKAGTETAHSPGYSEIVTPFLDKKGKIVELTPEDRLGKVIGAFDQFTVGKKGKPIPNADLITAFVDGDPRQVRAKDVDYYLPDPGKVVDVVTSLIPFVNSAHGNRAQYSAKQQAQTVPLLRREVPLVQVKSSSSNESLESLLGEEAGAVFSPVDGEVTHINDSKDPYKLSVNILGKDGDTRTLHLPKNFPLAGGTYFGSDLKVKKGDKVKRGDLISDSSFTKDGTLSLGVNLRTAYMPWKTDTFEDSMVISDSAAEKMTSQHIHQKNVESPALKAGRTAYNLASGTPMSKRELSDLDNRGIIKAGTKIEPGQILMVGAKEVDLRREGDRTLQQLKLLKGASTSSKARTPFQMTWDSDYPGEVLAVNPVKKGGKIIGANIDIKTEEKFRSGDKLFGRHGNKGVVSRVIPDEEMPRLKDVIEITDPGNSEWKLGEEVAKSAFDNAKDADASLQGKPAVMEILLNPLGIPSRINPSQSLETFLGKRARKLGAPEIVDNFGMIDNYQYVKDKLKDAGISDTATIVDPVSGREIKGVGTGVQYITKAKQTASKKTSARGLGSFNPDTGSVTKGDDGAQLMGELGNYGLLSQNAREVLRDIQLNKTEFRPEVIRALKDGRPIPKPKNTTGAFARFNNYLRAAGVNPVKDKEGVFTLKPLTDENSILMSGTPEGVDAVIAKPYETIRGKYRDMGKAAIRGGLFDPEVVGGKNSNHWSRFELSTKMPNPIYEQSIRDLLGIRKSDFRGLMDGSKKLKPKDGGPSLTGASAVEAMLKSVDLTSVRKELEESTKTTKDPKERSRGYRALRMVNQLQDSKLRPEDAFMRKQVSVVPLNMRGMREDHQGNIVVDDINYLYRDIGLIDKELKSAKGKGLPPKAIAQAEAGLYSSLSALAQTEGSKPVGGAYQGILGTLAGIRWDKGGKSTISDHKSSFFKKNVVNRRQAFSARAVLSPDDDLHIDEVGLPRNVAASLLEEEILRKNRELGGVHRDDDQNFSEELSNYIKNGKPSKKVEDLLGKAIKGKYVVVKRDPVLHSYGIQGFRPKLLPFERKSMGLNPLVYGGFGADNDGDCVSEEMPIFVDGDPVDIRRSEDKAKENDTFLLGPDTDVVHTEELIVEKSGIIHISQMPRLPETRVERRSGRVVEYDVPKGVRTPAWDEELKAIRLYPITKISEHYGCVEVKCTFTSSRTIVCSDSHSLAVLDPDTLTVVKATPEDAKGRCSPRLKSPPRVEGGVGEIGPVGFETKATYDNAWWLGAIIGDGWASGHHICLAHGGSDAEKAVAAQWEKIARENHNPRVGSSTHPHEFDGAACVSHKKIMCIPEKGVEDFRDYVGHGAPKKHLPPEWPSWPLDAQRGLFAGLMDTDGTVCWSNRSKEAGGPQPMAAYSTKSPRLASEVRALAMCLGLETQLRKHKRASRTAEYQIWFSCKDVQEAEWLQLRHLRRQEALEKLQSGPSRRVNQNLIVPLPPKARDLLKKITREQAKKYSERGEDECRRRWATWYSIFSTEKSKAGTIPALTAKPLAAAILSENLGSASDDPEYLEKWARLAVTDGVDWEQVVGVERTGRTTTMWDITVPGSLTFTCANGIVVWDTLAIALPLTAEAQKEVRDKMLPSKNLINPSSGKLEFTPSQEAVSGISRLSKDPTKKGLVGSFKNLGNAETAWRSNEIDINDPITIGGRKTTFGKDTLDDVLPSGYKLGDLEKKGMTSSGPFVLEKKSINKFLTDIAINKPKIFPEVADRLRKTGQYHASYGSISVTMDDLKPSVPVERAKYKKSLSKDIFDIQNDKSLTDDQQDKKIRGKYAGAMDSLSKVTRKGWMDSLSTARPNSLAEMVHSGARGNFGQLEQMLMAPVAVLDSKDQVIRTPIMSNYTEGLGAAEYWSAANGARKGAINKVVQVRDPGALSKAIINSSVDQVITEEDCGTHLGTSISLTDSGGTLDAIGRYLAAPLKVGSLKLPAGHALTMDDLESIRAKAKGGVKASVRSPLGCKAEHGLCQKDAGKTISGDLLPIGTNLGAISGQALGERSTQLMISSFHSGGRFDPKGGTAGGLFEGAQALLRMPENMSGKKATLATDNGTVQSIKKDETKGGYTLDATSPGGLGSTNYFFPNGSLAPDGSGLTSFYKKGQKIKKGDLLTMGYANPGELFKITGDMGRTKEYITDGLNDLFGPYGIRRRHMETVVRSMSNTSEVTDPGKSTLYPGQRIPTPTAEKMGAKDSSFKAEAILKGVNAVPRALREDYLSQLNSTHLRSALTQSIAKAATSDLHGLHPIPGLGAATEFNRPGKKHTPGAY